ncbi:MAG TPA: hypothetical protein VFF06_09835 [Polyangia bacterium]|nr:hypothetical protein [Polyangia bacterium]
MRLRQFAVCATLLWFAGCNGDALQPMQDAGDQPDLTPLAPDLSDGVPSTMFPAPHQPFPQAITGGGPVLTAPVIVPVFFSNDDATERASLEDFVSKIGATKYWQAATEEYGVGAATATAPVELTETATGTIADAMIQSWLAGKLGNHDPAFPAPTANTVYALHYPMVATITLGGGTNNTSCNAFGGYHSNIQLGGQQIAYAVIPRCNGVGGLTRMQNTTAAESHELVEAATDPYPQGTGAYETVDTNHRYWARVLGGGEVGDLCAQEPGVFTQFPELAYTVQRTWSNAAAMASHDPCVPALANEVYFNTVPELDDMITTTSMGGTIMVPGVHIPVGMSKTVALDLFSDAATTGPWSVKVVDAATLQGGTATMTFALDRTTGVNGERLHVTITTVTAGSRGTGVFAIESHLGPRTHFYFGLVGQQ